MKLNLLFDLYSTQPCGKIIRHGGGIYGEIVYKKLLDLGFRFSVVYNSNFWINPELIELVNIYKLKLWDISKTPIDDIVKFENFPTIYCPVDNRLSYLTRSISTIHGLRRIEMPNDWMQLKYKNSLREIITFIPRMLFPKYWKQMQIKRMSKIIFSDNFKFVTVSKHSKYSFLSYFPQLPSNSIHYFYSPSTTNYTPVPYVHNKKYFLLVSGNRWEKNNLRALIALDELITERSIFRNFDVIITGVDNLASYKWKFKNTEDELHSLYSSCYSLIYPSLNEGFGYPPVEAMSYGKPVIASAITSITEICDNAAIYFNPFDIMEIKNRIISLIDSDIYNDLKLKSQKRYSIIKNIQNEDLNRLIDWIVNECK